MLTRRLTLGHPPSPTCRRRTFGTLILSPLRWRLSEDRANRVACSRDGALPVDGLGGSCRVGRWTRRWCLPTFGLGAVQLHQAIRAVAKCRRKQLASGRRIKSGMLRSSKVMAVLVAVCLWGAGSAQASPPTRLLGYQCPFPKSCRFTAMYEPGRSFYLGNHYWFTSPVWKSWNQFAASAIVTLHYVFPGARPGSDRTMIIFFDAGTLCGVRTYTRWVSGDGNSQVAERNPAVSPPCGWYLGSP